MTDNSLNGFDYPKFIDNGNVPCAETYPDAFFSEDPLDGVMIARGSYTYEREAKQICFSCEYRIECLTFAVERPELVGIWGGSTEGERRRMRKGGTTVLRIPRSRIR